MFQITRSGDYAIRGMVYLAGKPTGEGSLLSEIASNAGASQTFMAKIFQQFNKLGLVKSQRGTGGGFQLARPAEEITLLEIVEAVEGPIVLNRCILAKGLCSRDSTCTVHPVWKEVQENMTEVLSKVTLRHLAGEQK